MANLPAFSVDLRSTGDEGATYHIKNAPGGEIQRSHLVDRGSSLVTQGDLIQVLHGSLSPGGDAATLVIMNFSFLSSDANRRFTSTRISVLFAGAGAGSTKEPEVIGIAPLGHFSISPTSTTEVSQRTAGLSAQGGPFANVNAGYSLTETVEKQHRTTLTGSIRLEGRNYGEKNAAAWSMTENESQKNGIPTSLRVAILLRRKDPYAQFIATVQINASVDFISSVRTLFGSVPEDDPVVFDPSQPPTSKDFDLNNLGGYSLEGLSEVKTSKTLKNTEEGAH